MSVDSLSKWTETDDFDERIPLPHEDFDTCFKDFASYDSMLESSLNNVQDLSIAGLYESSAYNYLQPTNFPSNDLPVELSSDLKPAQIAKFSRMMNYNNVAVTPDTFENRKFLGQAPITPQSSPHKHHISPEIHAGLQLEESIYSLEPPPTPMFTPSNAAGEPKVFKSSNFMLSMDANSIKDESESEAYFSSPSHSPALDTSPEFGSYPQFLTGITPNLQAVSIFPSNDLPNNDPIASGSDSDLSWQPVVSVPKSEETERIIKTQRLQSPSRPSNRKSCLPPGKVDEYLAGPNDEGLFECLYPGCGKLFRRRYNVRSHIQTHLCDRPYACGSCGARFVRPHDLRRHEKVHKQERPYVCPCGKGFTRHDALQRHRIRMICEGGIEIPGKPRPVAGRRGRPRKKPLPTEMTESDDSPEGLSPDFDGFEEHFAI